MLSFCGLDFMSAKPSSEALGGSCVASQKLLSMWLRHKDNQNLWLPLNVLICGDPQMSAGA